MYQDIINLINTYITANGSGAITGSKLNQVLNAIANYYGFDGVTVETLPPGSSATATVTDRTLNLGIPAGRDGVDGVDATNPFKGWWMDFDDLKNAYTATPGDSAYVKDAAPATTWSIYIHNNAAASDNYWADSGLDADTSTVQTFRTGEEVNEVGIANDLDDDNPLDLLTAPQGKILGLRTKKATIAETKVADEDMTVQTSYYVNTLTSGSNYGKIIALTGCKATTIELPDGCTYVRFRGLQFSASASGIGYSFADSDNRVIKAFTYKANAGSNARIEYYVRIPKGAKYFMVTSARSTTSGPTMTQAQFYCYIQTGETLFDNPLNAVSENNGLSFDALTVSKAIAKIGGLNNVEVTELPFYYTKGRWNTSTSSLDTSDGGYMKFDLTGYDHVAFKKSYFVNPTVYGYAFLDEDDNLVEQHEYGTTSADNFPVLRIPEGAKYLITSITASNFQCFGIVCQTLQEEIMEDVEQRLSALNIDDIIAAMTTQAYSDKSPFYTRSGYIMELNGWRSLASVTAKAYAIDRSKKYYFSGTYIGSFATTATTVIVYAKNNGDDSFTPKYREYWSTGTPFSRKECHIPDDPDVDTIFLNVQNAGSGFKMEEMTEDVVDVKTMQQNVDEIMATDAVGKLMKVVVSHLTGRSWGNAFYIRTRYNAEKDIILQQWLNGNGLVSFHDAYIGPNTLTDDQLRTSDYKVVDCSDCTAPLFNIAQYWHLFGQHGYLIPTIDNSVGLTAASVGTIWQDVVGSTTRRYHIGKVTDSTIYLLPEFTQDANGHLIRSWKTPDSSAITTLTFVSAGTGTDEGVASIAVTGYSDNTQLRPIMSVGNRKLMIDGREIDSVGTYYCDEFRISETQIGYDPATFNDADWFGGNNGSVDVSNAQPMAEFTFSYCWVGATCTMNTTINVLREVECLSYGVIQQQFFRSKTIGGTSYTAKVMIPKHIGFDTPINTPSSNDEYYRIAADLVNIDDPVDRQIGFLVNTNEANDYAIGLAAGLSLVSGDTVKEKRVEGMTTGASTRHQRVGSISPSLENKFYVAAFNTSKMSSTQYYIQPGFFKELNCYVSYFDPSQNKGQVYWYKDGSRFLIYCHCQTQESLLAVNVPAIMDGLHLSVVEKTSDASLKSDTIANGKFFIEYANSGANYIVLKAE